MATHRLLVVEDDNGLRNVLARGLRAEGYEVITARDGQTALRVADAAIGGVILDIGLPDSDGRDVCQAMRARGLDAPVIFLSGRGTVGDRLIGFAAGADDYLAKPFAFAELIARLQAVLRRRPLQDTSRVGDLVVDPVTHALRRGESTMRLTPTEFRLLARLLASHRGVVRRNQLKAAAWPAIAVVSDNLLDQYIAKLRRRLTAIGADDDITVVRGVGYTIG